MVRARRVLIRAVAAAALVVAADAVPSVASSVLVRSAVGQGFSTCPLLRPAPTGTLDVRTKAARYYGGFSPDSTVVLCAYDPATVLDVTLATPTGVIGLPGGIAPTPSANGSHHYVLIGVGPTGRTVALTQEVVGPVTADPVVPQAAATPTPTPTPTQRTTATTAAPSGIDVVVVITGTSAPGDGGGPGGGGAPGDGGGSGVLARTGGPLGLLAGGLGLGLLVAGLLVVFATRRRGKRQESDLRALR